MRSQADIEHDFWYVLGIVVEGQGSTELRQAAERIRTARADVRYVPLSRFMKEAADTLDEWAEGRSAQASQRLEATA